MSSAVAEEQPLTAVGVVDRALLALGRKGQRRVAWPSTRAVLKHKCSCLGVQEVSTEEGCCCGTGGRC